MVHPSQDYNMARTIPTADIALQSRPLMFKNLLINGGFKVNQRASATKTTTTSAYNYDRWYYDGTYLYGSVAEENLYDGTFGLSWLTDATATYQLLSTATVSSGLSVITTGWTAVTNGDLFTIASTTGNNLWVRFAVGLDGLNLLDKVQLEADEVTPFEVVPYDLELHRCLRYYEIVGSAVSRHFSSVGSSRNELSFIQKHSLPTITRITIIENGNIASEGTKTAHTKNHASYIVTAAGIGASVWNATYRILAEL